MSTNANAIAGFTPEQLSVIGQIVTQSVTQVLGTTPKAAPAQVPVQPGKKAKATQDQAPADARKQPGKKTKQPRGDNRTDIRTVCKDQYGREITVGRLVAPDRKGNMTDYGWGINIPGSRQMVFFQPRKWRELSEIAAVIPHVWATMQAMMTEWEWDLSVYERPSDEQ